MSHAEWRANETTGRTLYFEGKQPNKETNERVLSRNIFEDRHSGIAARIKVQAIKKMLYVLFFPILLLIGLLVSLWKYKPFRISVWVLVGIPAAVIVLALVIDGYHSMSSTTWVIVFLALIWFELSKMNDKAKR